MADFMKDLSTSGILAGNVANAKQKEHTSKNKVQLDMTDFLTLMITELTSQSIDQTADTSDMLNQMVQMQMVQAMVNMTDASMMTYAASLVGKDVTVGQINSEGKIEEVYGTVTGTGTMNGSQVVFVNDKYYYLNEIMAVGKLPEKVEEPEDPEETPKDPETPPTGGVDVPKDPDKTEDTNESDSDVSEEVVEVKPGAETA